MYGVAQSRTRLKRLRSSSSEVLVYFSGLFFFFSVTFEYFYKLEKSIFEDLLCFGRGIAKKSIPINSKDVVPMILLS